MIFKVLGVLLVAFLVALGVDRALHLLRKPAAPTTKTNPKFGRD